jgi:hypothetical protein
MSLCAIVRGFLKPDMEKEKGDDMSETPDVKAGDDNVI